jgi:hypothetical protein
MKRLVNKRRLQQLSLKLGKKKPRKTKSLSPREKMNSPKLLKKLRQQKGQRRFHLQ